MLADEEFEELLYQDSCQKQDEPAKSLNLYCTVVSKPLNVFCMIQRQGNWVPNELKPIHVEKKFFTCEQLIRRQKMLFYILTSHEENSITYNNPKCEKVTGFIWSYVKIDRRFMIRSSCSLFGGTTLILCSMSCFNQS
ncbi:mariner Mos1 transposase [Trichonephila clavipes]|uniref:Mariner Mos1 transposase n=1 Tax=Trichonephila clavipes TaxID=2585209 RepID=A0A8X6RPG8_TRICX|nr:mariner Mos1 transposase [Trichonephila clavipes]